MTTIQEITLSDAYRDLCDLKSSIEEGYIQYNSTITSEMDSILEDLRTAFGFLCREDEDDE